MNIHLPAILGFTRYQGFDPSPYTFIVFVGENWQEKMAFTHVFTINYRVPMKNYTGVGCRFFPLIQFWGGRTRP